MASVPHTLSDTYKSLAPILCLCQELRLPSSLPHRASSIASPSPKSPATTLLGQTCPKATVPPPHQPQFSTIPHAHHPNFLHLPLLSPVSNSYIFVVV